MGDRSTHEGALAALRAQDALIAEVERIARIGTYVYETETGAVSRSPEMDRLWPLPEGNEGRAGLDDILYAVHPEDQAEIADNFRRLYQGGERTSVEPRVRGADGEWRYLHVRSDLVRLEGRVGPVLVGTVQDVTELREAERTIAAQNERLKEMQAELLYLARQSAMGTMAATLAHELNQPLTAISSYASGLRRTLESPDALHLLAEGLTALQQNALRAGEIIRRMREMARTGASRREALDLRLIAEEAARFASIGHPDVSFDIRIQHQKCPWGDPIQMQQVLVNLFKNACEAMSGKGCVTVATRDGAEAVEIMVQDAGPGIPSTLFPGLFDGRTSTKEDGMGIGLSISRTIVEAHGGSIRAHSGSSGATFSFTIPAFEG